MYKIYCIVLCLLATPVYSSSYIFNNYYEIGTPLMFVEGCEADFDGDGQRDIAILLEDSESIKLIVLLKSGSDYRGKTLFKASTRHLRLRCVYSNVLEGTASGKGDKEQEIISIDGIYLMLYQPESTRIAFYWEKGEFHQIWLSD